MIRSSSFYRFATRRHNACMPRSTTNCGDLRHRNISNAQDAEKKGKAKAISFFEEVDERMKRDSPEQYKLFLKSKAAWESKWKLEQRQRQDTSRRRVGVARGGREASMVADPLALSSSTTLQIDELRDLEKLNRRDDGGPRPTALNPASPHIPRDDTVVLPTSNKSHPTYIADRAVPSKETTTPSWGKVFNENLHEPMIPTISNNEVSNNKKGGGVFSSISKNVLMIKSANINIPLSELFPSLYATDLPKTKITPFKKHVDPVMMFDPDDFEAYEQAMTAVFEDEGTIKAISKFERKMPDREAADIIVQKVKDWLLNKQRIVEPTVMRERWNNVDEAWKNAKWMTGLSRTDIVHDETEAQSDTMFVSELKAQQQLFLLRLQENELGNSVPNPEGEIMYDREDVASTTALDPVLFYEVTQHFIGSLGRYCARRARSTPMVVAWWKVKESGLLLRKDVTANFLYVCSTMGVADSMGMRSGVGAYFTDRKRREESSNQESTIENEQSRFLIPEEVATYHDLSSKPTESSISLRVKALASKGNAKSAEELVEAFKVSGCVIYFILSILCTTNLPAHSFNTEIDRIR
jgi:hypothetical protein